MKKEVVNISKQTLCRLPYFLGELKKQRDEGKSHISSGSIAISLGLSEVQVRKDLASVSSLGGKPKFGFEINALVRDIENFLGYNNTNEAVLVGAGSLGRALISYKGFADYGIKIVTAFDLDSTLVGSEIGGIKVLHISTLSDMIGRLNIKLGIITTPASQAQKTCDVFVSSGICAIWNFAPIILDSPDHVLIHNENMAASLAQLSAHLK